MNLLCKLGLHKYGRATYVDLGGSNVVDYKQKCQRCSKIIRWTQPKGTDYRFYPTYWSQRKLWWYVLGGIGLVFLLFLLVRFI